MFVMLKRTFDIVMAAVGLVMLSPLLGMVAVYVKLTSPGPALFKQERIGLGFRPFMIYKFRSMVVDAPRLGAEITAGDDPRITGAGRILRKMKIDELPQLVNVLKGDMSFVGPRPEARKYVEMFRDDYEEILQVRPGVTDLASIEYRDESTILGMADDPEKEYVQRILPEKIRVAKDQIRRASFWFDLTILAKTVIVLFSDRVSAGRAAGRAGGPGDQA